MQSSKPSYAGPVATVLTSLSVLLVSVPLYLVGCIENCGPGDDSRGHGQFYVAVVALLPSCAYVVAAYRKSRVARPLLVGVFVAYAYWLVRVSKLLHG